MDCIRLHVFLIKCSVSVNCYILYFYFQLNLPIFDFVSVRPPDYVLFRHISSLTYFSTSRWCLRKSTILKPLNCVAFQSSCLSKPCAFTFMYILSMFIPLTFFVFDGYLLLWLFIFAKAYVTAPIEKSVIILHVSITALWPTEISP